jgi:hypothetical protein
MIVDPVIQSVIVVLFIAYARTHEYTSFLYLELESQCRVQVAHNMRNTAMPVDHFSAFKTKAHDSSKSINKHTK